MLDRLRDFVRAVVPGRVRRALRYCWSAKYRERCGWDHDRAMGDLAYGCTGGLVAGGPFKGLRYVSSAMGSTLGPKLMGTYEKELIVIIEQIIVKGYDTVINIGAGEGYYTVGLAKRMPGPTFVCFEAFEKNREELAKLAALNGVDHRVKVHGFCTPEALGEVLSGAGNTLIVCDVEGAEFEILDPQKAPGLRAVDMLVEMHDAIRPGVSSELKNRFSASHQIEVVWTQKRTLKDWPREYEVTSGKKLKVLSESRGVKMSWLWMAANSRTAEAGETPAART